jgi:2,3-bisphosphoglycerate-independent phosphoglycerate mutase
MYTVGEGIAPESDAGVFSLLGYDPLKIHLSRGVVETIGANVPFERGDLALRAGFATVEGDKLVDRRAGRNLSTEEARQLGEALNKEVHLKEYSFQFKATVGHRAVVVFRKGTVRFSSEISNFDPAYVRQGKISIAQPYTKEYDIPKCEPLDDSRESIITAALVNEFGFKSRHVLDKHPVNEARRRKGKKPANFVLMRDPGTERPEVESFESKWSMRPVMVADLPAELGIGKVLGMHIESVAPGTSQEDYHRRADLVRKLVQEYDFVYVHLKGPDEPGHDGLFDLKRQRIEEIDSGFFSVLQNDSRISKAKLCVTCDHSTPCKIKGHSDDPVPVLITVAKEKLVSTNRFTEKNAMTGSLGRLSRGITLLERLREMR